MLKNISNLGAVLNKQEQQFINGGIRTTKCRFLPLPCDEDHEFDENCKCVPKPM
ncbi:hypothetical protein C7448_102407 [Tenacibaculum gallaicum]|uniref:Uncharacterized protein n=1 Tax=Tenacibaculum gallaicum TaxID=561505 RepID=A0A3E0I8C1_9FLAO|nr:hypothetical protein [Tenacibaculum gallaicum]REH54879.1 hypothetical protein C7448_102407 [Tenacibaculum gallaicum]